MSLEAIKPLRTFGHDTSISDALRRLGISDVNRSVASAWSWDGPEGAIVSIHFATPQPWEGKQGDVRTGELLLPLASQDDSRERTPVQASRWREMRRRLVEAADAGSDLTVLLVNWERDSDGRFKKKQLMYPHSAWRMTASWAEPGVVRLTGVQS